MPDHRSTNLGWREWVAGDSVNRMLARRVSGSLVAATLPRGIREDAPEEIAGSYAGDPNWLYVYLYAVIAAWCVLAVAFGLVMGVLAYLGDRLGGHGGRDIGLGVGAGFVFFCAAGLAVATVASLVAYAARQRYRRLGRVDASCSCLMSYARLYNGSLILQAAIGMTLGLAASAGVF
jgi:hypothetical protein